MDLDKKVRIAAFQWLSEQTSLHGDVLPRNLLEKGFDFQGSTIRLVGPQGIFKPQILNYPLSITTSPKSPYNDSYSKEGFLSYRYRGTDINHRDNVGLRKAFENRLPLIYFHGIAVGKYSPVWPVYIISDNPENLTFNVVVGEISAVNNEHIGIAEDSQAVRAYITGTVKQRLHQRIFREKVLDAYSCQCSFCKLKHSELLDAAHIIPDNEPEGDPRIDNGIALCKLHHAAFDSFILGITPDYKIEVRKDILIEKDGPMLEHGLVNLNSKRIILPTNNSFWPNQELLERRYMKFKRTG
ncbi:MAG: HNH endonuclease [bacterium]|nr:HNH endonuclease [bacterium]